MKIRNYVIALLALPIVLSAANAIEWLTSVTFHKSGADRVEFGLRSDGVVVWRKITVATNSPAESDNFWNNGTIYLTNSIRFQ